MEYKYKVLHLLRKMRKNQIRRSSAYLGRWRKISGKGQRLPSSSPAKKLDQKEHVGPENRREEHAWEEEADGHLPMSQAGVGGRPLTNYLAGVKRCSPTGQHGALPEVLPPCSCPCSGLLRSKETARGNAGLGFCHSPKRTMLASSSQDALGSYLLKARTVSATPKVSMNPMQIRPTAIFSWSRTPPATYPSQRCAVLPCSLGSQLQRKRGKGSVLTKLQALDFQWPCSPPR